jgi:sulfofructose kinase
MSEMQLDVVGLGHCAVDYLGVVERYPDMDSKTELSEFSMQGGGPVATAMVTLATLGVSAGFFGKISDDDFGIFIRQGLRDAGVDTSGLVIEPGKVSPYSFIAVERKTAKRTVFWTRGNVAPMRPDEIRFELMQGSKILHVDGNQMDAQIEAAKRARSAGMQVVYDAGSPRERMDEMMKLTDVLIASERFAAEMGSGALAESLKRLHAKGPQTVVITIGEEGSVGMENDETYIVPATAVTATDTTGAGDVYHGAFIYGMLQGWGLRERMRFANTAAALKCRSLGGRAGIPSLEEVHEALSW